MKRILSIAAVLLLCLTLCGCSEEEGFPKPSEKFFVNDFAQLIDDSAEDEFVVAAQALDKATTAQVVIVTVENLNGLEPYEYATELGRAWGVGSEESNNGIVVLLSLEEREIFIAVGYGLEGALPDSKTGRIIDVYGLSYLKNDKYSEGLSAIGRALINEVYIEYGLEPESGYVNIENVTTVSDTDASQVTVSWFFILMVLIILTLISRRTGRGIFFFGFPTGYSGGYSGSKGSSFGGFRGGGGSFGGGGAGRGF